mgnify:CR=1 FL=1
MTANVFNIQHFSLDDGPGIRTVIFFKDCPLNCAWCHNPESKRSSAVLSFNREKCVLCGKCKKVCTQKAHTFKGKIHSVNRELCVSCGKCAGVCPCGALYLFGKSMTADEIMEELAKDDMFFANGGGVTFSGGEPMAQWKFALELAKKCKNAGYSICIETSGFAKEEAFKALAPFVSCFLYDCKETDDAKHILYTGVSNKIILSNIELLNSLNAAVTLRCPIIPDINDRIDHFTAIADIADKYECIKNIQLLPYHPLGISKSAQIGEKSKYSNTSFLDNEVLMSYADVIRKHTKKQVIV